MMSMREVFAIDKSGEFIMLKIQYFLDNELHLKSRLIQERDLVHDTIFIFFHCRRSPISIAAAIIFMVTQLSESKKPLRGLCSNHRILYCPEKFLDLSSFKVVAKCCQWIRIHTIEMKYRDCNVADISIATTVAEGTIKNAYRDLYPHAAKMIPEWYAKERDLKNLSSPKAWKACFNGSAFYVFSHTCPWTTLY